MSITFKENTVFEIGEKVVHKKIGLCMLEEMTKINGEDYYVLTSSKDTTKIMIPAAKCNQLIRKIVTKQGLEELLVRIQNTEVNIITDFKVRVKKYDQLLKAGEIEDLIILLKMISNYKKEKKNLNVVDKEILKATKNLLFDELAYVLNIQSNEVEEYLLKII